MLAQIFLFLVELVDGVLLVKDIIIEATKDSIKLGLFLIGLVDSKNRKLYECH